MYSNLGEVSYERLSGIYITHQVGRKEHNDTKSKERSELTKKVREELMMEKDLQKGRTKIVRGGQCKREERKWRKKLHVREEL